MKTVSIKFLEDNRACYSAKEWFESLQKDRYSVRYLARVLFKKNRFDWINWGIVRMMNKKQKVMYAIFAAEQVIKIYEEKYPDDNRPRLAIEAAKKYLKNPSKKTKAADAAYADAAADAAAYAAAYAYAGADADTAAYAAYAAAAAKIKLQKKIINYGLKLIKK